jgi:hypothetical protein
MVIFPLKTKRRFFNLNYPSLIIQTLIEEVAAVPLVVMLANNSL